MLGIKFIKSEPTTYLIQYRHGKVKRQGPGLSFFYFAPTTSLVAIDLASSDSPFIFSVVTADFQEMSVQGQVTYRVSDALKLSKMMNFSLDPIRKHFLSEDPQKVPQRVINTVQVAMRAAVERIPLREALKSSQSLMRSVRQEVSDSAVLAALGIEIIGLVILAIAPSPETSRALEAEAREGLLKEADDAVYSRRNSAVQQERAIKENELNTEIAVENKKKEILEAKLDAEKRVQQMRHEMRREDLQARIGLEEKNKSLVELSAINSRTDADARAYGISAMIRSLSGADAKIVQALVQRGLKPEQVIAHAFEALAENAKNIGELNVSPDLLRELINRSPESSRGA